MEMKLKINTYLRRIIGASIVGRGLLCIFFIGKYVDFVSQNFQFLIGSKTLLVYGATLMPFIEFFIGLLILLKINIRAAVMVAIAISSFMSFFIVMGNLSPLRLMYHIILIAGLLALLNRYKGVILNERTF